VKEAVGRGEAGSAHALTFYTLAKKWRDISLRGMYGKRAMTNIPTFSAIAY